MKHQFADTEAVPEMTLESSPFHSWLSQYLIVLSPNEALWQKIMDLKKQFADAYNCPMAYSTKPHITLTSFIQNRLIESRLLPLLHKKIAGFSPTKIELKDYGSFPTHTIFINITSKVPIVNMVKELRDYQQLMTISKDIKPYFITEPHVTIARKLEHWQYEKAWLAFQHMEFTGRFIADSITILRRPVGGGKYTLVEKFAMQSLPTPQSNQGSLF